MALPGESDMTGTLILSIYQTEGGRYKVYVTGSAEGHLMDWAGLNLRHTPARNQPRLGFTTFAEAEDFHQKLEKDVARLEQEFKRARNTGGSWLPESRYVSRCFCNGCRKPHLGGGMFCRDCPPPHRMSGWCSKHWRDAKRMEEA